MRRVSENVGWINWNVKKHIYNTFYKISKIIFSISLSISIMLVVAARRQMGALIGTRNRNSHKDAEKEKKVGSPIILSRFYPSITSGGGMKSWCLNLSISAVCAVTLAKKEFSKYPQFSVSRKCRCFFFAYKEFFFRDLVRPRKGIPKRKKEKKRIAATPSA